MLVRAICIYPKIGLSIAINFIISNCSRGLFIIGIFSNDIIIRESDNFKFLVYIAYKAY